MKSASCLWNRRGFDRLWVSAWAVVGCCALVALPGCSRFLFRQMADEDAYGLLETRQSDSRWQIPGRVVEPESRSRMALDSDPDCGLLPPDDPAANCWMRRPYRFRNHRYWDRFDRAANVETSEWWACLPRNEAGRVDVTPELAIDLALLHSRDFQTRYEQVYLAALSLSGNRFDFLTQWAGGAGADFNANGDGAAAHRFLNVADRLGLAQQLAAGGQFATNLVNSFAFQLGGANFNQASGTVVATLTQPLLRGAGRYVRLESLTQAERNLLYDVRDFAHFRREFYLDVVSGYYSLLTQVQSLRNVRSNLESLQLNLEEHEVLYDLKLVSLIQVDQVYQQYQSGRANLLSAEQNLANALDSFKFQLGLPPWVEIEIDETLLKPFEFTDPTLTEWQDAAQQLYLEALKSLPPEQPSDSQLQALFDKVLELHQRVVAMYPQVQSEIVAWQDRVAAVDEGKLSSDDQIDHNQVRTLAARAAERFADLQVDLAEDANYHLEVQKFLRGEPAFLEEQRTEDELRPESLPPELRNLLSEDFRQELAPQSLQERKWAKVYQAVGRRLRERIAELFVAQTQARIFSIGLPDVDLELDVAVEYAVENRLDLMNTKAQVTDAFRRVEVAANALRTDLDVGASAALATDPGRDNAGRFDSSANSYALNLRLDGPLNRLNERNSYRAAQIGYQQARRRYMGAEDTVANTIRRDLRQLRLGRLNFQIARQQLITATRQVDEAQANLRASTQSNSNLTRDLLQALQGLLSARNDLISNWFGYKVTKARLFVDLELLYLNEGNQWINEDFPLENLAQLIQNEYGLAGENRPDFPAENAPANGSADPGIGRGGSSPGVIAYPTASPASEIPTVHELSEPFLPELTATSAVDTPPSKGVERAAGRAADRAGVPTGESAQLFDRAPPNPLRRERP